MAKNLKYKNLQLAFTVFVSQVTFTLGNFSSFAIPIFIALAISEMPYIVKVNNWNSLKLPRLIIYIFLFFTITAAIFSFSYQSEDYLDKFLISGILFLIIFTVFYSRGSMYDFTSVKNLVVVMHFFILIDICQLDNFVYGHLQKSVFPFSEISHFAVMYSIPAMLVVPSYSVKGKFFTLFLLCIAFYLNTSLTMLIVIILVFSASFRLSGLSGFCFLLVGITSLYFIFKLPYFMDRVLISGSSDNLSVLVYYSGLEAVWSAITDAPIGYGFQGLGVVFTSETALEICDKFGFCANRYDGSFLLAKIVAEFGYIGLVLSMIVLYHGLHFLIVKHLMKRNVWEKYVVKDKVLMLASLGFFVELFIRGMGYFSLSFIMYLCIVLSSRKFQFPLTERDRKRC